MALFFTKLSGQSTSTLAGDLFVLSGALGSAFSGIATKRTAGRIHPVALICWQSWISWPLLGLMSWWLEAGQPFVFTNRAIWAILYLGLISAAFGFVAFAWLLQRNSATRVTALTFLAPVFGVSYSWFFFGETFTPLQLLGVMAVCLGVYVVNSRGALRPRPERDSGAHDCDAGNSRPDVGGRRETASLFSSVSRLLSPVPRLLLSAADLLHQFNAELFGGVAA